MGQSQNNFKQMIVQSRFGEFGWMLKVQTFIAPDYYEIHTENTNSKPALKLDIAGERLRQARYSFNLALIATALSVGISLIGSGLLLWGKVPEGAVTATGGMAASVRCIQLAKDANDRLDRVLSELNDEE